MNKSKEYVVNTLILLFGKFATQFLSLFLLPLYTNYLLKEDYGLVDLYQTYISLFVPVFLLCLDSAVFRFLVDERNNDENKKIIINSSIIKVILQSIILVLIFLIIRLFIDVKYSLFIVTNVVAIMFSNVFLQICRGIGKNKNYSFACIVVSFITLISNLFLILVLHYDASSILISSTLGNFIGIIYIFISTKLWRYLSFLQYDKSKTKELLKYSVPLIPNALSWWIVNVSDRTIISFLINSAANGIYSVSCKFSNILNSIFSIFTMSWQESASLHINDDDKDEFFTNMINSIYKLFVTISLLIIIALTVAFPILIGNEYMAAYNYIPILILANSFNVLIGLFGGIYIAKKLTKKMTSTTIYSAIINLIVNLLLVKKFQLYAACLSTLVAYSCMAIYRYFDVQKYVKVRIKLSTIFGTTIAFIVAFAAYFSKNMWIVILSSIYIILYSFFSNKTLIFQGFKIAKNKFFKKNT